MAKVPACDVCGAVSPKGVLPPRVEPCRFQTAVADYDVMLCRDCMCLPLPKIVAAAEGAPGGTVDGAARGPYMVRAPSADGKGPAPQ